MKQILVSSFLIGSLLIPTSNAFAILGFGLSGGVDQITLDKNITTSSVDASNAYSMVTQYPMDQTYSFGGYIYTNILPIIDLELEYQLSGGEYNIQCQVFGDHELLIAETGVETMYWVKDSFYLTARKKMFGLGIPILGGVKLHAGAGVNTHRSIPILDIEQLEEIRGDDLNADFDPVEMEDKIVDYLTDNITNTTGGHVQVGMQASLLAFDLFLNYRYTIAELFPDKSGYSSLNLMLGFGF